jgi:hypothetical protein
VLIGTHYARFGAMILNSGHAGSAMKKRLFGAAISVVLCFGCNGMRRGSGTVSQNSPAAIRVENEGFTDMNVYALRSAQRVRLGLAPGHASTRLTVPMALMNGPTQLRFIADPVAGSRPSVSEEITVAPGDSVVLTIPPL